ncbi:hypothetical protein TIFTF001_042327 [Ficus carica]|uniref:Agenet domain-containing protein n=1 Tax=Ficus carica TaxID=3494 RepID=A0AA87ZGP9_FICCA|nr:hypothetical protein TIFTF001_042327 [Ficus carica]
MEFVRGDKIEVCIKEEGFLGSYYEATVVSQLPKGLYVVQYKELFEESNESEPLVETVRDREVRPVPPQIPAAEFRFLDVVDAFDNDGWWVGKISGKKSSDHYYVFFEITSDEIAYPVSRLRAHLDWVKGKWVSPKNKAKKMERGGEGLRRIVSSDNGL